MNFEVIFFFPFPRFSTLTPGAPALHPFQLYAAGQPTSLTPLERERLERLGNNAELIKIIGV